MLFHYREVSVLYHSISEPCGGNLLNINQQLRWQLLSLHFIAASCRICLKCTLGSAALLSCLNSQYHACVYCTATHSISLNIAILNKNKVVAFLMTSLI